MLSVGSRSASVEVGQEWAVLHGGTHDLIRVVDVLAGKYLRPPDVALIPTEFCRVEWLTGRLKGQVLDQRSPGHVLGRDGSHVLYRRADGTLTEWAMADDEERKRLARCCPICGHERSKD